MYNEEVKKTFLETLPSQSYIVAARAIFNDAGKFESMYGVDLGLFDKTQTITFLNSMKILELQTVRNAISMVKKYQSWANSQLDFKISKDDFDFVDAIHYNLYGNAHSLILEIQNAIGLDEGYFAVPALCFAWMGIELEEARNIPYDGIDFIKGVVYNQDKLVVASFGEPEITEALLTYFQTTEATRTQNRTFTVRPLFNEKFLHLMVTHNSKKEPRILTKKNIMTEITILKDKAKSTRMTYANVLKSGKLNRLYRLEKSGVDVFSSANHELVQQIFADKNNVFDNLFLYRKYKEAFNLQ